MVSKRLLRALLFAVISSILTAFPVVVNGAGDGTPREVTILFGAPLSAGWGDADFNYAHYAAYVQALRDERPGALYVGTGDSLGASALSYSTFGAHMVAALNRAGLTADTYGNRDFDYGPNELAKRVQESAFAWVSANVIDRRTGDVLAAEEGARRFVILEVNGVRIGITGIAPHDTPAMAAIGPDVVVLDPVAALREVVPEMRAAGAQLVVVLAHERGDLLRNVAAAVDGIDVIVGDHSGQALEQAVVVGRTLLAAAGTGLEHLGEFRLWVNAGRIERWEYVLHRVRETIDARGLAPHPAVLEVIDRYDREFHASMSQVIGHIAVPFDTRPEVVRTSETAVGNFVADRLREWGNADVAFINAGALRGDRVYPAGPFTFGDLLALLPYPDNTVILRLDGARLLAVLENSVGAVEARHGRFLHVSGLEFAYDPDAPPGQRVRSVRVGGRPLDPEAPYTVVTTTFLASGADEYTMLPEAEVLVPPENGADVHFLILEAFRSGAPVGSPPEGRIVRIQDTAENSL